MFRFSYVPFFVCFLSASTLAASTVKDELIVQTASGKVRGVRFHYPSLSVPVDAFLGIPFAKPPLGYLRFRHPQPVEPWLHIHNATRLPNSCYQTPDETFGHQFPGANMWNPPTLLSEDCLYLNVWVPRTRPRLRRSAVMVWIYGGAFSSGTTTLSLYDGKVLAAENNIIVVSIAYRLGALGFFALDDQAAPGNAGLFDQLMALQWIQTNIRHFGGDPNNVTLFGESAGSVSVNLHLLSPLSGATFQRAILQSGAATMPSIVLTMPEAKQRSLKLALEFLGCENSDDMEVVADCVRAIPAQRIVDYHTEGPLQFTFLPLIDGLFITGPPEETMRRGAFKKCPILVGSNLNEGSYFVLYELLYKTQHFSLINTSMSREQFEESVSVLFPYYPRTDRPTGSLALNAIKFEYTNWADLDNALDNLMALDAAVGDSMIICPLNAFAFSYAAAGERVYSYRFTQRYASNPWPTWAGVLHGDEIVFVFGEALRPGRHFTEDEKELSRAMMRYWTNFAKNGDPNEVPGTQSGLGGWPVYAPPLLEHLELSVRYLGGGEGTEGGVHRGPPRARGCAFWDEYLPRLVNTTASC